MELHNCNNIEQILVFVFRVLSSLQASRADQQNYPVALQCGHEMAVRRFAPQAEQKVEPAVAAEPQVPQRPGIGGT